MENIANLEQLKNIAINENISYIEYPGKPLMGKERYKKLYHFTSFDTFVKIWLSKRLLFSPARYVNDLFEREPPWSLSFQNVAQLHFIDELNKQRWAYRQISLTMDYDTYKKGYMSTLMWGYYADKGNGVCIELNFDDLDIPKHCIYKPIEYKEHIRFSHEINASIQTQEDRQNYLLEKRDEIFFTKDIGWKGENEFRILSNEKDDALDITNAISAVYLTSCNSNECILAEKLVQNSVPIKSLYISADGNITAHLTKEFRQKLIDANNNINNALRKIKEINNRHNI